MLVYNYHPETKEFIGSEEAFLDPLETERKGKPIYLLPANATFITPPPPIKGYTARWIGKVWEMAEDHRPKFDSGGMMIEGSGTQYWLPGDDWTSSPRYMLKLGPLPEGAITTKPEKPEEVAIRDLFNILREERNKKLAETDYLMTSDYPIYGKEKKELIAYRQSLRDFVKSPGAPWDGGGENTPWPEKPNFLK